LIVLAVVYASSSNDSGTAWEEAKTLAGEQVAYYSMAVTFAELVWHFPEAMRDLFFSKVASSSHNQARLLTPVLSRLGLLLSLVGATGIVLAIDPTMAAITWAAKGNSDIWYDDWSEPVRHCLWLLVPGTVGFTVSKVLQADLAARDHLQTCINAQVAVLVVMLGLDIWLVPEYGAAGAAAASTIAYAIGTIWTLQAYCSQTGVRMWHCLLVQRSDFRYIRDIVIAVINKVRRKES
jgi:Na+-driven multidrug efflux pump